MFAAMDQDFGTRACERALVESGGCYFSVVSGPGLQELEPSFRKDAWPFFEAVP